MAWGCEPEFGSKKDKRADPHTQGFNSQARTRHSCETHHTRSHESHQAGATAGYEDTQGSNGGDKLTSESLIERP